MAKVLQFPTKEILEPTSQPAMPAGYTHPDEILHLFGQIPEPNYYMLRGKEVSRVDSSLEWSLWFAEATNRVVGKTRIGWLSVSTVFLGMDHNLMGEKPHLFETMIYSHRQTEKVGENDISYFLGLQKRYSTWDEAFKGHQHAIDYISSRLTFVNCMQRVLESQQRKESEGVEQQDH